MRIEDLSINEPFEKLTLKIIAKTEPREVSYFNTTSVFCSCLVEDGTGEAYLLVYDEDVEKILTNNIVEITNGKCKIDKGKLQLIVKNGSLNLLFEDFILEQGQQKSTSFLEDIVNLLNSGNPSFRKKACEILGEKKKVPDGALSRLLILSKKEYCAETALKSLIEIAKVDDSVRRRFPEILDIKDEQLRFELFLAVFDEKDSHITDISEYSPFLIDRDARIRKIARVKLLQKESMKETLKVVFDGNNKVAIDELFAELTRFSDEIIRTILLYAFNHKDSYVNASALSLAKKLGMEKLNEKAKKKREEELKDAFTAI